MIEHCDWGLRIFNGHVKIHLASHKSVEFFGTDGIVANHFRQKCRCARGIPIVIEFAILQATKQAERIVYIGRFFWKMIPVIFLFQLRQSCRFGDIQRLRHIADFFGKRGQKLFFCNSTDWGVFVAHAYRHEIAHGTENTELAELGNPRNKCKADVVRALFEDTIKIPELIAYRAERGFIHDRIEQRCIIFVDEDDGTQTCFEPCPSNEFLETCRRQFCRGVASIDGFIRFQHDIEAFIQTF